MVREVVNSRPDMIFVVSTRLLIMLKEATTAIPLVGAMADPVRVGLVASMARPGGNITGVAHDPGAQFNNKRLELLKQVFPSVSKLGILISHALVEKTKSGAETKEAARRAGIEIMWPIEALFWREGVSGCVRTHGTGRR